MSKSQDNFLFRLAIFASGAGSNAHKIIDHFQDHSFIEVALIVSNNKKAGVLEIAQKENIPVLQIEKETFNKTGYESELKANNIQLIVLAGFLWKVPAVLIQAFPDRIINIHPALLPAYGGKGMYGRAVHEAVLKAGERVSGITIHYVDDIYDNGKIIFQAKCIIEADENPESLAEKIHILEHSNYPKQIETIILQMIDSTK